MAVYVYILWQHVLQLRMRVEIHFSVSPSYAVSFHSRAFPGDMTRIQSMPVASHPHVYMQGIEHPFCTWSGCPPHSIILFPCRLPKDWYMWRSCTQQQVPPHTWHGRLSHGSLQYGHTLRSERQLQWNVRPQHGTTWVDVSNPFIKSSLQT